MVEKLGFFVNNKKDIEVTDTDIKVYYKEDKNTRKYPFIDYMLADGTKLKGIIYNHNYGETCFGLVEDAEVSLTGDKIKLVTGVELTIDDETHTIIGYNGSRFKDDKLILSHSIKVHMPTGEAITTSSARFHKDGKLAYVNYCKDLEISTTLGKFDVQAVEYDEAGNLHYIKPYGQRDMSFYEFKMEKVIDLIFEKDCTKIRAFGSIMHNGVQYNPETDIKSLCFDSNTRILLNPEELYSEELVPEALKTLKELKIIADTRTILSFRPDEYYDYSDERINDYITKITEPYQSNVRELISYIRFLDKIKSDLNNFLNSKITPLPSSNVMTRITAKKMELINSISGVNFEPAFADMQPKDREIVSDIIGTLLSKFQYILKEKSGEKLYSEWQSYVTKYANKTVRNRLQI